MTSLFMPARFGRSTIFSPVRAGEHGGRAERQRRGRARGDHGGLASEQRRDPLADAIVQLVQHHVVLGRVFDRVHHFRRHQRGRHGRVGPGRVDEWPHAELFEVVAPALASPQRLWAPPMRPPSSGSPDRVPRKRLLPHPSPPSTADRRLSVSPDRCQTETASRQKLDQA